MGLGQVLVVDGTGNRTQGFVDFNGLHIWVAINGASLAIVHKRHEE